MFIINNNQKNHEYENTSGDPYLNTRQGTAQIAIPIGTQTQVTRIA